MKTPEISLAGGRRWALLASIFLISFVVLAFEVSLTRIFSVLFRYHFAFLAVSGAVCGLGIGGFICHLLNLRKGVDAGWSGIGLALFMPLSLIILFGTPLGSRLAENFWAAFVTLLPFAFAGIFLAEVFRRIPAQSGWLYQADMMGAALAAVLIVPLIGLIWPLYLPFLFGILAAASAACWALASGKKVLLYAAIFTIALLGVIWPVCQKANLLRIRPLTGGSEQVAKPMLKDLADPTQMARIIDTDWTAYARTDLVLYDAPEMEGFNREAYTDGDTPTMLIPFDGDLKKIEYLQSQLAFLACVLKPHKTMLSIGPGGGLDFLLGKMAGFEKMDGVEINTSLARIMQRQRGLTGDIWHQKGINVSIDDGRSYVRRSPKKYDLIISALTLSATTGKAGMALVESYIYTKEAFSDYYKHLNADGRFVVVTQVEQHAWRAGFTALEVMQQQGINPKEAARHIMIASVAPQYADAGPYRHILIWKRSPLTKADTDIVTDAIESGFLQPIFVPGYRGVPQFMQIANGEVALKSMLAEGIYDGSYLLNLNPVTDDKPFFVHITYGIPDMLVMLLVSSLGAAVIYTAVLLWRRRKNTRLIAPWCGFFSALGVGFMLAEIPLAQKFILFLGHPTLSLAAILFCLLVGASIGSRMSQQWGLMELPRRVAVVSFGIAVLILMYALGLSRVLDLFLFLPLFARLVVSAVFLLPLGMALGVPFPSGMRLMSITAQAEIPWMWGINGMMSVVGSTLAAGGAELVGFSGCLVGAALIYGVLALAMSRMRLAENSTNEVTSLVGKAAPSGAELNYDV